MSKFSNRSSKTRMLGHADRTLSLPTVDVSTAAMWRLTYRSPEVKAFSLPAARQPVYFGFIRDAQNRGCNCRVIDGPERLSLAKKAPQRFYSALFFDITRNDL